MKEISKERMAEFLSEILPDDIDLCITKVVLTIEPKMLPSVEIHTSPCAHSVYEIWDELQKLRSKDEQTN